ncbi:MAG: hypothetical protein K2U26_11020 [Cyclobacteriaceae bacterium]|nr:hypothetical protein [Cyclobacteriaceae bacterium]
MRKFLFVVPIMICSAYVSHAQQLAVYKTFGGLKFEYQKDTTIFPVSPRQVATILKDDPLAYAEFKKARTNNSVAGVVGFLGGVMIGLPLGTAIGGGEPEWGLAAGGAALIVASIPFSSAFRKHSLNAVEMYNKKHTAFKPRFDYFLAGAGVRLVVRF